MSDPSRKRLGLSLVVVGLLVGSSQAARVQADDSRPTRGRVRAIFRRPEDRPWLKLACSLLGELNCTSCHRGFEPGLAMAHLNRKQAPAPRLDRQPRPTRLPESLSRRAPRDHSRARRCPDLSPAGTKSRKLTPSRLFLAVPRLDRRIAPTPGSAGSRSCARRGLLSNRSAMYVCHGSRKGKATASTTVQLSKSLEAKYTIPSPHRVLGRPAQGSVLSGRMPGLRLKPEEANAIAQCVAEGSQG